MRNSTANIQKNLAQQGKVSKLKKLFHATESVVDNKRSGSPYSMNVLDHTANMLTKVVASPYISIRATGQEVGISHLTAAYILKQNKYQPCVRELHGNDCVRCEVLWLDNTPTISITIYFF